MTDGGNDVRDGGYDPVAPKVDDGGVRIAEPLC